MRTCSCAFTFWLLLAGPGLSPIWAQPSVGLSLGWTRSTLTYGRDLVETDGFWARKNGFMIGAHAEWPFSKSMLISTELTYARRGFVDDAGVRGGVDLRPTSRWGSNLDYIGFMPLVNFKAARAEKGVYLLMGAGVDILIYRRPGVLYLNGTGYLNREAQSIRPVALTTVVGFGLVTTPKSTIELRFNRDINDVSRLPDYLTRNAVDLVWQRTLNTGN